MFVNNFKISEENLENDINVLKNIDNPNYLNNNIQLNNKFDTLLNGILLEKNKGELIWVIAFFNLYLNTRYFFNLNI